MSPKSCEPKLNSIVFSAKLPIRNHYFSGKAMNADDMILEQKYFIEKLKRINSELSGYGIVNGLTIALFNSMHKSMEINPGVGVDSHGNLQILYVKQKMTLPRSLQDGDYIYLKFTERGEKRVPRADDKDCGKECCFNYIMEETEVFLDETLFTLKPNEVCYGSKGSSKINDKAAYLKNKTPFLLLGRYRKTKDTKGNIDSSVRPSLHSNAELSQLLCDIEKHHVRSLNGKFGDLTAVTTLNGEKPNAAGDFEILAGNNISIETDNNKITVATKNGSHQEYHLTVEPGASKAHEILHNQHAYPSVDVYKRIGGTFKRKVYEVKEIQKQARDLQLSFADYMVKAEVEPLEALLVKKKVVVGMTATRQKSSPYLYSNARTKTVLDKHDITEYSPKVLSRLDKEIKYNVSKFFVRKSYQYEKVLSDGKGLPVKVTHLDNTRVSIENLSGKDISLLVILNT